MLLPTDVTHVSAAIIIVRIPFMNRTYAYYPLILALYVTFQLVSDVSAGKLTYLFGFSLPATIWYFPVVYVLADILTEVYGYEYARRAAWTAFFCSFVATGIYQLVIYLPPASTFLANDAYSTVLNAVPRVLASALIGQWCGTFTNDYIMAKMKVWTKGKYLWTRTIGSTIAGESITTVMFYGLAFYSVLPAPVLISAMLAGTVIKTLVEIILTPWTYFVISKLKKWEHEDHYDTNTNFNPFIIR